MLEGRAAELERIGKDWEEAIMRSLRKHRRLRLLDGPMLLRFVQHCSLLEPAFLQNASHMLLAETTLLPYLLLW